MGRRSKATLSRINNLPKPKNPQNPTVEDVSDAEDSNFDDDDLLEHGFFFLDEGTPLEEDLDGSDNDSNEEVDEEELNELKNEADIKHFSAVLAHAQAMAVKAEREAAGEKPKRKRHYTGNSDRTKRHHAQKRRQLEATGQKSISSMFTKKGKEPTACVADESNIQPDIIEIDDDSDPDDNDDEVEVSLKQLFPDQRETTLPATLERESQCTTESEGSSAAREQVEELLRQLREGRRPQDDSPEMVTDQILNGLSSGKTLLPQECYRTAQDV